MDTVAGFRSSLEGQTHRNFAIGIPRPSLVIWTLIDSAASTMRSDRTIYDDRLPPNDVGRQVRHFDSWSVEYPEMDHEGHAEHFFLFHGGQDQEKDHV